MTASLAVVLERSENCATVAQPLADLPSFVDNCTDLDGEVLGEYVEHNWKQVRGNTLGLMHLAKEMKRKFKGLDRKKQVNGTYLTIRGFRSFDKWVTSFSGTSRRQFYYLLETEEKKNERNAGRRSADKKKDKVVPLYREGEVIEHDGRRYVVTNVAVHEDTEEKSSFIVEVEPYNDEPEPPSPEEKKAKRSAAAKKANESRHAKKVVHRFRVVTGEYGSALVPVCGAHWTSDDRRPRKRNGHYPEPACAECNKIWDDEIAAAKEEFTQAANTAAAQPVIAAPAPSLGECEMCGDAPATETVNGVDGSRSNECAECAASSRKYDRKYLIRQMGVAKVMGKFRTIEDLVKLGGKTMDFGDGETFVYPTFADYIARLKKKFLGNPMYDQTVVGEYIARLEKKMEAMQ